MGADPFTMMAASFVLSSVGSLAQMRAQQQAAAFEAEMANREGQAAILNAEKVRESAERALTDQQEGTREVGEQKKSDAARQADRENAQLVALMAERGQLSTTSFLRQTQQLYYFNELDLARIDADVDGRISSLQADKEQVVEDQKRVYNSASLAMYGANTNAKLKSTMASQAAFMNIVASGTSIGVQGYKYQTMQQIAKNLGPGPGTVRKGN